MTYSGSLPQYGPSFDPPGLIVIPPSSGPEPTTYQTLSVPYGA